MVNYKIAQGFAYASGDQTEIIAANTAPTINYIHGWSLSSAGSATAMLYEYGGAGVAGSRVYDIVEGRGGVGNNHSTHHFDPKLEMPIGSALYLTVDGVAEASAVVYYMQRD